jgi:hypothetical protein
MPVVARLPVARPRYRGATTGCPVTVPLESVRRLPDTRARSYP